VVPIGGGGLIAGVATAVKAVRPDVRIFGVEAAGAAGMRRSLDSGHIATLDSVATVADGIAVKSPGARTLAVTRELVDEVVTVGDDDIIRTVLLLMERCKQMVEGAGAVGVAALLAGAISLPGMDVVAVLSGGNIDMTLVGRFIARGLALQGRYLALRSRLVDRPGELLRLLAVIAEQKINVLEVTHHRAGPQAPIQHVEVSLTLETRDREHCEQLLASLRDRGFLVVEEMSLFDQA
jgi:threonine dehydratase